MNILVDGQTLESAEINRGIGVYFKNVLNNMVKQSYEHNWYITVSNVDFLRVLDPWVVNRLIPLVNNAFAPNADFERATEFSSQMKSAIEEVDIDILWIPNPLMINVLFPNKVFNCKVFATVYDLIPFIMPIKEWSNNVRQEYNRRLTYLEQNNINLICISESTKNDIVKSIGNVNTCVTFLAADSKLFYKKRVKAGINRKPYIVFTGGFDYRKNIYGAIEAFKKSTKLYSGTVMDKVSMYIVCKCSEDDQLKFYDKVKKLGLEGRIKLTGYISDKELAELYVNSDVFFFPSLYEGFGLPILEAMLGGAFILSGDNSSLPEVCSDHAILCNVNDTEDMAEKLYLAFQNASEETAEEKQKRQEYALGFSWEKTAMKTLDYFKYSIGRKLPNIKEKIAIATPWPNQKTGIANYMYKLIPYLSEIYDVDIFVDNRKKNDYVSNEYGGLYDIEELETLHNNYKEIIYEIGNNILHKKIYEYSLKYRGIAEIHDYILHPFFYHTYFLQNKAAEYRDALELGYGEKGLQHYNNVKNRIENPNETEFPMSHTVCSSSKMTIFHNHWSKNQVNSDYTFVIPLACFDKEFFVDDIKKTLSDNLSRKIGRKDNEVIIGCFGFVNTNKRPEKIFDAIKGLIKKDYNIKLIFFGKANDENIYHMIKSKKLQDNVFITGYLEKGEYEAGLEICDVVINLRYPSMGESSATLCEAFKYGKPVLVSNINQYREFPDEICWKVDVGDYEVPLLERMLEYLINNGEIRNTLGANAMAYADAVLNPENIAKQYYEVISKISEEV